MEKKVFVRASALIGAALLVAALAMPGGVDAGSKKKNKSNKCGLYASHIIQRKMLGRVVYSDWIYRYFVIDIRWTTEGNLKKMLNKAWNRHNSWQSEDYPPGREYIEALRRHTAGPKVAAAITHDPKDKKSAFHWYVVNDVVGDWDGSCKVSLTDVYGNKTVSCATFAEWADFNPFWTQMLNQITDNDIVFFTGNLG